MGILALIRRRIARNQNWRRRCWCVSPQSRNAWFMISRSKQKVREKLSNCMENDMKYSLKFIWPKQLVYICSEVSMVYLGANRADIFRGILSLKHEVATRFTFLSTGKLAYSSKSMPIVWAQQEELQLSSSTGCQYQAWRNVSMITKYMMMSSCILLISMFCISLSQSDSNLRAQIPWLRARSGRDASGRHY